MTLSMLALLLSDLAISETVASTIPTTIAAIALFNLCVSVFVLLAAVLSARIGRRWTFLLGLGCFALGTVRTMVAQDSAGLILDFSLFGGIGKALVVAIIGPIIGDHSPAPTNLCIGSRITGMVAIGTVVGLCAMLATSAAFGWRWSFAVVALIALADLALAVRVIRLVPRGSGGRGFDPSGVMLARP
jgi:DHA1 family inner membrane transport protein